MSSIDVLELVDRLQAIGLGRGLRPARAAGRRGQRQVRVGVDRGEVELDLRAPPPAASPWRVEAITALSTCRGEEAHGAPSGWWASANTKAVGRLQPRRDAQGRGVEPQHHVRILVAPRRRPRRGVFAGDRHREHAAGQPQRPVARADCSSLAAGNTLPRGTPFMSGIRQLDFGDRRAPRSSQVMSGIRPSRLRA